MLEERIARTKCVLFDLDGTLIDTVELILTSMRHTTETVLGEALPDDVLMRDVGIPLATQLEAFSAERVDELITVYREHNWRVHDDLVKEYPGVTETLVSLRDRGLAMGVVTSKMGVSARRGLALFGLDEYLPVIVACDDVDKHKPLPDPLLHAAAMLGMSADECAYVGDSPYDMAAARAAGMISIAATWGVFSRGVLEAESPDVVVSDMLEVSRLFGSAGV